MSNKPTIPGQELERAAANVAEYAGKGLFDQLKRMLSDGWAKPSARIRAEASEIRKNIEHAGRVSRSEREVSARRQQELMELDHQANLEFRRNELANAYLERFGRDMIREQARIEQIAFSALEYKSRNIEYGNDRDISDDWLYKFFRYAGQIDEPTLLDVLAKALAEAATRDKPLISNRALDTLRFFDAKSKGDFQFISSRISIFGYLFREHQFDEDAPHLHPDEYNDLFELGLIKISKRRYLNIGIADMNILFSFEIGSKFEFEYVELTQVGLEIANLFDSRHKDIVAMRGQYRTAKIIDIQQQFGMDEKFLQMFSDKFISSTIDSLDLGITIWALNKNGRSKVFDRMKNTETGKYSIKFNQSLFSRKKEYKFLRDTFLKQFEEFDQRSSDVYVDRIG